MCHTLVSCLCMYKQRRTWRCNVQQQQQQQQQQPQQQQQQQQQLLSSCLLQAAEKCEWSTSEIDFDPRKLVMDENGSDESDDFDLDLGQVCIDPGKPGLRTKVDCKGH